MKGGPPIENCPACAVPLPDDATACARCGFELVAPGPFKPGLVLEARYRIDVEVGRGGMGVVYRGTDLTLKRPVAIKALRQGEADPAVLARFLREARALAQVEHPGLVPVYAVGREDGAYYLVMKFVEGRTLQALLKAGRLPAGHVRRLVEETADALGALHRHGLIHRDIKPGNLIVGENGRITVMDLGIVKSVGENTQTTSTALGTPRYMAPEMLGAGPVDGRADQYALAVIAYEALAGATPFDGPTPMAILYKQAHETPEPVRRRAPDAPRNLAAAIERALAKQPDDRFADMSAFAAAVHETAVAPVGRARTALAALAAVGLIAAGAAVVLAFAGGADPAGGGGPAPPGLAVVGGPVSAAPMPTTLAAARPHVGAPDAAAPAPVEAPPPPSSAGPDATAPAPAAPRPAARSVEIVVTSDPAGATVLERGARLGRTPLTLRRPASPRTLSLVLEREGYADARVEVSLTADKAVRARLEPLFELVP